MPSRIATAREAALVVGLAERSLLIWLAKYEIRREVKHRDPARPLDAPPLVRTAS